MIRHLILPLLVFIGISCGKNILPEEPIDYSLNQLELGISFPPQANEEQIGFSIMHMNTLNVDLYRINQHWADREPAEGNYNWLPLGNRLMNFGNAGKKVLLTLDMKNLPTWWISITDDSTRIDKFSVFCGELLSHFSKDISMIQFGNEWNWEVDVYLPGTNKDQLYIGMANALYEAVKALPEQDRPSVVLGSLSIGGLRFISYAAGSITNVQFQKGILYNTEELASFDSALETGMIRLKNVITNVNYDIVDLHLYDDFQNWATYLSDLKNVIRECGKFPDTFGYIAGEFGGPHPQLEPTGEAFATSQLIQYIRTLDNIGISQAFFFMLVEEPNEHVVHHNSYLIDKNLTPNSRYEIVKKFCENSKQ